MTGAGARQASLTLAAPVPWVFGAVGADNAGGIERALCVELESTPDHAWDGYGHGDRAPRATGSGPGAR